ncbi:MAG TPA: deoxyribonuclease V [Tepidisphaeraceae bacterium]|jgi:deoxyribonuclease V
MRAFAWSGSVEPWKKVQAELRARTVVAPLKPLPRFVAGADCAFADDGRTIVAAAVVYDRETKQIVEHQTIRRPCDVPYISGYLSFREAPAILDVIGQLKTAFGAILFDGQGIAHPRRCGLATHVGVTLDVPSVGVAKSRLIGTHAEPAATAGSHVPLMDKGEQIGVVLRTRDNVNPLYVSVGHRIDLDSAIELVLASRTKFRLPEPTRMADKLSKVKGV